MWTIVFVLPSGVGLSSVMVGVLQSLAGDMEDLCGTSPPCKSAFPQELLDHAKVTPLNSIRGMNGPVHGCDVVSA